MRSLATANATDVSLSVLWTTDVATTGFVRYGFTNTNGIALQIGVVPDVRGAAFAGRTHFVQVGGVDPATGLADPTYNLAPDTEYWIDVLGADLDTPLASQTVRTGPLLDQREPDNRYGVVQDSMGNPVPDALVLVTLADADGAPTPGEAAPFAAVANDQGHWLVNLGSARTADLSAPFVYTATDRLRLAADAGDGRRGFATVLVGTPPPLSLVVESVAMHTIAYGWGWNTVALPVRPITLTTLGALAHHLNGDGRSRLSRAYRYADGAWEGALISGTTVLGTDFVLVPGEGYFLAMVGSGRWSLLGAAVDEPPTHTLRTGWNLIGLPVPPNRLHASEVVDSARHPMTGAHRLIEVDRWIYGNYEGHVAGYPLNDFPIQPDRAYFVRATETFQWRAPMMGNLAMSSPSMASGGGW